jgi:hypothetical protein
VNIGNVAPESSMILIRVHPGRGARFAVDVDEWDPDSIRATVDVGVPAAAAPVIPVVVVGTVAARSLVVVRKSPANESIAAACFAMAFSATAEAALSRFACRRLDLAVILSA